MTKDDDSKSVFRNVYVIGVFDLFHSGHVRLLERARAMGGRLVVAVNGDDMVAQYKGRRPAISESDRLEVVLSCRYVDEAFVIRCFDNKEAIVERSIDAIVHGDDWPIEAYLEQIRVSPEFLQQHGVSLVMVPYSKGISTTEIINKIRGS